MYPAISKDIMEMKDRNDELMRIWDIHRMYRYILCEEGEIIECYEMSLNRYKIILTLPIYEIVDSKKVRRQSNKTIILCPPNQK